MAGRCGQASAFGGSTFARCARGIGPTKNVAAPGGGGAPFETWKPCYLVGLHRRVVDRLVHAGKGVLRPPSVSMHIRCVEHDGRQLMQGLNCRFVERRGAYSGRRSLCERMGCVEMRRSRRRRRVRPLSVGMGHVPD